MSRECRISFDWADGTHVFRLAWGEIAELQEKTGCGPQFLYSRMAGGAWRAEDVYETLRLGLIGGGMPPIDALRLTDRYVKQRPLLENLVPAQAVLLALLQGVPEEPDPGKDVPGAEPAPISPTDGSTSPGSMDRQP